MSEAPKRRVIKKVDGGHGHHGGAWKVAYADFVTAMMALFMVMWLLASTDESSRKEISNYFRTGVLPEGDMAMNKAAKITPSVIETSPAPPPPGDETIDDTAVDMKAEMKRLAALDSDFADIIRNHVDVKVTGDGVLIEIVDEDKGLLFDPSSSKLKEPLEHFLKTAAPMLQATHAKLEINGHTDATPFAAGTKRSNWDLSYERANTARELLVGGGVTDEQIAGVYARGSSQPYLKDNPYAAQNRRLSILVKLKEKTTTKAAGSGAGSADVNVGGGEGQKAETKAEKPE